MAAKTPSTTAMQRDRILETSFPKTIQGKLE